jgi:hypothetical protein
MYSEDNHRIEIVSDETDVASSAPSERLVSKGKLIKNQIQRILGFNTSTMLFVLIVCMIVSILIFIVNGQHSVNNLLIFSIGSPNDAIKNRGVSGKFKKIPGMYLVNCSHQGYVTYADSFACAKYCLEMQNCYGFDFYPEDGKAFFCVDKQLEEFDPRKETTHFYLVSEE